jgi:hypothetical protein
MVGTGKPTTYFWWGSRYESCFNCFMFRKLWSCSSRANRVRLKLCILFLAHGVDVVTSPVGSWIHWEWTRWKRHFQTHFSVSDQKFRTFVVSITWLVVEPTPLKNMFVSWDDDIPNIWKVSQNSMVPNHQPVPVQHFCSTTGCHRSYHGTNSLLHGIQLQLVPVLLSTVKFSRRWCGQRLRSEIARQNRSEFVAVTVFHWMELQIEGSQRWIGTKQFCRMFGSYLP